MIWQLFQKSVKRKPIVSFGPTVDERVMKWGTFEGREYQHLWDDKCRYGWRIFFHNLLCALGVPARWLGAKVEEYDEG